jgi:hypothetical protein
MNRKVWGMGGVTLTGENWSTWRKICPCATLSTTNTTMTGPRLNPSLHSDRSVTICARNTTSLDPTLICLNKHHTMKVNRVNWAITPYILNFSSRWRWMVRFTPLVNLILGKGPRYPINEKVGGPQRESGGSGALAPAGNRTPNPPSSSPLPNYSGTWAILYLWMYMSMYIYWNFEKSRKYGKNYLITKEFQEPRQCRRYSD